MGESALRDQLPTIDDLDAQAKKLLDAVACTIGRNAVNHLKDMYPDALKAVAATAEISLRNSIRNDINFQIKPLLMRLVDQKRKGLL